MGTKVRARENAIDKERQPDVIERRTSLFFKYVYPFANMIYKLCIEYSSRDDYVEENYTEAMLNFYRRIETYDPTKPIRPWIHTCVKHQVWACDRKRHAHNNKDFDNDIEEFEEELLNDERISNNCMGVDNWREMYSEDIVSLLDELKPCYRDALILQEAGYSLREIAEIEFKKGSLKTLNMETLKSRLRMARQHLKNNLTRDGKRIFRQTDAKDVL